MATVVLEHAGTFTQAFVTLVVVMDPFASVPVFLSLTGEETPRRRRTIARQAAGVAAGIVLAFALAGQQLLGLLDLSLQALQVAGGALLALVAVDLLRMNCAAPDPRHGGGNVAFVPLGTPLLAGPGAIAATMLFIERAPGPMGNAAVVLALVGAALTTFAVLRSSEVLARRLGEDGLTLMARLAGLVTAAIAVELVADGIATWPRRG